VGATLPKTTYSEQLISLKIYPKEASVDAKQNGSYICCPENTKLGDMAPKIWTYRVYRPTKDI
jgi:hypothetical protein